MSLDIIKDIGLTIFTLLLYGGPNALFDLPNSYRAAIIISMFASIFIPLLISSLHLTINNLEIFLSEKYLRLQKMKMFLITASLFLFSPFLPVILQNYFLEKAVEAAGMARNYNIKAVEKKNECQKIKKQLASIVRIELGK